MEEPALGARTFAIVVTTIGDGSFLEDYFVHFKANKVLERTSMYVVGDVTTPIACRERVEKLRAAGLQTWYYLGEEEQEDFLAPFPRLASEIPWKSDNRRNIGFLMAYRDGCDVIISIDDDNFPKPEWPLLAENGHGVVGRVVDLATAVGYGGWFNVCSLMQVECQSMTHGDTVYPRGFPYGRRHVGCGGIHDRTTSGRVAVNAGLWSGDPDVDAATRLVTRCRTTEGSSDSYFLGADVMSPINTQNTGLIRDAIPAYYYVKMGHGMAGLKLDRFGDIFSGFFLQKCARAVGDQVRVGSPVIDHRRSPHNLYEDLWHELAGMVLIDDMLPLLEAPLPPADTYSEAVMSLAEELRVWAGRQSGFLWTEDVKAYFHNVADNMSEWVEVTSALSN